MYCVQTEEKKVALTFDAAGGKGDTQKILDILAAHQVQAAFFVTGEWVENYPEDVKKIAAAGHDIGSYGQTCKNMSKFTEKEAEEALMTVHENVKILTGIDLDLFRPPYGVYSNTLINTAEKNGYLTVLWNVDSEDWKDYGAESILRSVTQNPDLENGSIIRMHSEAKYTAEALEAVIDGLQREGYTLVTVSQLVLRENYHMDAEGRQIAD